MRSFSVSCCSHCRRVGRYAALTPTFARSLLQLRAVGAGAFYVYFIRVCPFCCCAKNAKMPNMHSRQLCQLLLLLCAACANVMRNSQLRRWQVPTNGIVLTVVVASQLAALRQLWSSTFFNAVLTFASEPLQSCAFGYWGCEAATYTPIHSEMCMCVSVVRYCTFRRMTGMSRGRLKDSRLGQDR